MKRSLVLTSVFVSLGIAAACSSSPTTGDGGTSDATSDTTQQNDSSTQDSSTNDVSSNDVVTTNDASDSSSGMLTLTIHDYLSWCNVTVNGGAVSTADPQTFMFAPNTMVTVAGDTASSAMFYWGYWGNVAPDGGLADGGEDTSKTVTFKITRDMTLNACCPDNGFPLSQCTF